MGLLSDEVDQDSMLDELLSFSLVEGRWKGHCPSAESPPTMPHLYSDDFCRCSELPDRPPTIVRHGGH